MNFEGKKNLISERVVQARKKEGITQGMLAARMQILNVNIDQQNISKIECNRRIVTDYELICLAKSLNVSIQWLLTGEETV